MSNSNSGYIILRSDEPNKITVGSDALVSLLVQRCAEVLQQHYPRYLWLVRASADKTTVQIFCLNVSSEYGYILYITSIQNDPSLKRVKQAGGEILERGHLARRFNDKDSSAKKIDLTEAKFKLRSDPTIKRV